MRLFMVVVFVLSAIHCSAVERPGPTDPPSDPDTDTMEPPNPSLIDGGEVADASCVGDMTAVVACGKCGTTMKTCVAGHTMVGACMGETGVCVPGDAVYTPDKCQIRVCGKDCKWPGWTTTPGAQCVVNQQCNAGPECDRVGTRKCIMCKLAAKCECI
jgi:hypothetical protein